MKTSTKALPNSCPVRFGRVTGVPIALHQRPGSAVMDSPSFHPLDNLDLVGDHRVPSRRRAHGGRPLSMRTTRPVLTAALLLALASGCTTGGSASPTPSESANSPTPSLSASPLPSPTNPKALARTSAEALARDYYAVTDEVGQDPDAKLSRLGRVATSVELSTRQQIVEQWRADGWRKTGQTTVAEVIVQSVNLDNSDPEAGRVPTVQVDVCYDVSDVDLVDEAGNSRVSPDRADRGWERLHVANYDYKSDPASGWRVASLETLEKAPCTG
ncbi:hypothetical protein [Promicromonospora sukumoe]|uniref:Uncharacterized protein n=1 Tax=Promicromonospora sukumoe TaxID=88382 RepID=A0A7W3PD61_9MICO|nr:hypothetical protein [Promicromonospora sukumoe]MBA8807630.1 hypothetical protein [Promicromonospora sukumoe]